MVGVIKREVKSRVKSLISNLNSSPIQISDLIIIFTSQISWLFSDLIIIFTSHNYFHFNTWDLHLSDILRSRRSSARFAFLLSHAFYFTFIWLYTWQSEQIYVKQWAGVAASCQITCDPYVPRGPIRKWQLYLPRVSWDQLRAATWTNKKMPCVSGDQLKHATWTN